MDDIFHYGVPGMKWGVRKERRSSSGLATGTPRSYRKSKKARQKAGEVAEQMDYKELQRKVQRLELEKRYVDLVAGPEVKRGKNVLENILARIGKRVIDRSVDKAMDATVSAILDGYRRGKR